MAIIWQKSTGRVEWGDDLGGGRVVVGWCLVGVRAVAGSGISLVYPTLWNGVMIWVVFGRWWGGEQGGVFGLG